MAKTFPATKPLKAPKGKLYFWNSAVCTSVLAEPIKGGVVGGTLTPTLEFLYRV